MHDPQKGCPGHVASQTANAMIFEIDGECIAKALAHKSNALIVRRNVGPLAKLGQHFNVVRQVIQWAADFTLCQSGDGNTQQEGCFEVSHWKFTTGKLEHLKTIRKNRSKLYTAGSVKANVEPFPSSDLTTQIRPPCRSTMRLHTANPIPVPGISCP